MQIVGKVKGAPTKSPAKAQRMSVNALFDENTTIPIKRPVESPKTAKGSRRGSRIVDFGQGDSVTFEDDLDPEDTPTPPPPPLDTPLATPSAAKPFALPDSDGVASPRGTPKRKASAAKRMFAAADEPDDDAAAPAPRVDTPPSPPGGPDVAGGVGSPPCADAEPRGTFSRILSPEQGDATANLIADYYESPMTKPRAESFSETLSETPSVDVATTSVAASGAPPPRRFIVRVIWRLIGLFVRGGV